MKRWGLFLLRVTTGWLLVMWGLDKLFNVEHGQAVAETFYLGIGSQAAVLNVLGVLQIILGALVVLGLWRRRAYPVAFVVLLITALGVWKSIIDPWGWFLDGSQVLFYPSAIIAAGALYALENHRSCLAEDHAKAGLLADALVDVPGVELVREHVETNILRFAVQCSAVDFVDACIERGVRMLVAGRHDVRAVMHRDVSMSDAERAGRVIREVMRALPENVN
jgi:uncharacterized membrane protein YphA (DoxX/SURF4 family)